MSKLKYKVGDIIEYRVGKRIETGVIIRNQVQLPLRDYHVGKLDTFDYIDEFAIVRQDNSIPIEYDENIINTIDSNEQSMPRLYVNCVAAIRSTDKYDLKILKFYNKIYTDHKQSGWSLEELQYNAIDIIKGKLNGKSKV